MGGIPAAVGESTRAHVGLKLWRVEVCLDSLFPHESILTAGGAPGETSGAFASQLVAGVVRRNCRNGDLIGSFFLSNLRMPAAAAEEDLISVPEETRCLCVAGHDKPID